MRGVGLLLGRRRGERPYTEEELEQRGVMREGWWHRDDLMGGFGEFQAPGFL